MINTDAHKLPVDFEFYNQIAIESQCFILDLTVRNISEEAQALLRVIVRGTLREKLFWHRALEAIEKAHIGSGRRALDIFTLLPRMTTFLAAINDTELLRAFEARFKLPIVASFIPEKLKKQVWKKGNVYFFVDPVVSAIVQNNIELFMVLLGHSDKGQAGLKLTELFIEAQKFI